MTDSKQHTHLIANIHRLGRQDMLTTTIDMQEADMHSEGAVS